MLLIWIAAFLVIGGVILGATQTLRHGRLSDPGHAALGAAGDTLEPKGQGRRLGFRSHGLALALIALGCVLFAVAAATWS